MMVMNKIPEYCFYDYSIRITAQMDYPDLNGVKNPNFKQQHFEVKFRHEKLNRQCFYEYLGANGFITTERLIRQPRNEDSVSIIVSMGKIRGINIKDYINMAYHGTPTPDELELHDDTRARYLDSAYSLTDLIHWLESKGVHVPLSIDAIADEIQKWQQVTEQQTNTIKDDGADKQNIPNQNLAKSNNTKINPIFSEFVNLSSNNVSIVMMNNGTAKFVIKTKQIAVSPSHLGLKPNSQGWKLLEGAAVASGDLTDVLRKLNSTIKLESEKTKIKTAVSRLREKLISSMGLIDDPIIFSKGSSYKFAFKTMTHEILSGGNVSKGSDAMDYISDFGGYDDNKRYEDDYED